MSVSLLKNQRGGSILNLMATLALVSIFSATAMSNISLLDDPLKKATSQTSVFFQVVRAKAMSSSSPLVIKPTSTTRILAYETASCSDLSSLTATSDELELDDDVVFDSTSWNLCFSANGFANSGITVTLRDTESVEKLVQVALGGGLRVQ